MVMLRQLDNSDVVDLQHLVVKCKEYLLFQEQKPVSDNTARDLLRDRPAESKVLLGIYDENVMSLVGIFDLIEHYREFGTLTVVLMLIDPSCRSKGVGSLALAELTHWAMGRDIQKIRLGVLTGNDSGRRFWISNGFIATGETKPYLTQWFDVYEKKVF